MKISEKNQKLIDFISARQGHDITIVASDDVVITNFTIKEYKVEISKSGIVTLLNIDDNESDAFTLVPTNGFNEINYDVSDIPYKVRTSTGKADHITIEVDDIKYIEMYIGQ